MSRQIVRDDDGQAIGWFDPEAADWFDDGVRWDGSNMVGLNSRDWTATERLARTPGGRWVLERASRWEGAATSYQFVSDAEALTWLITSDQHEGAITQYFPESPVEVGPGRPEIGPEVKVRLPADVLAAVDARAEAQSVTRAEALRRLITAGLTSALWPVA